MVPARHLRAGAVHRVRREDHSRRAGSDRRLKLHQGRRTGAGGRPRAAARDTHAPRRRFIAMAIDRQGTGLTVLRICLGVFFFFEGLGNILWFLDTSSLAGMFASWSQAAPPGSVSHWYLERSD